jgi:hypothetical protein
MEAVRGIVQHPERDGWNDGLDQGGQVSGDMENWTPDDMRNWTPL